MTQINAANHGERYRITMGKRSRSRMAKSLVRGLVKAFDVPDAFMAAAILKMHSKRPVGVHSLPG